MQTKCPHCQNSGYITVIYYLPIPVYPYRESLPLNSGYFTEQVYCECNIGRSLAEYEKENLTPEYLAKLSDNEVIYLRHKRKYKD